MFNWFWNIVSKKAIDPMPEKELPILKAKKMRDRISLDRAVLLHPAVRQQVIDCIEKAEAGFPANMAIRIVQGLRTFAEQDAIYAQGRTTPGPIVTHAKAGKSYHNFGLAVDFALIIDKDGNGSYETLSWDTGSDADQDSVKDWQEVVKVFEAAGWDWGGKFSKLVDMPHLQRTFNYKVSELLNKYNAGKFILGTKYVAL